MAEPRVSVIIPNYNYAHYLPQAIESVLAQSYPRIETIVVDDGSTDNSRQVLEAYTGRVRCIQQQNQGVSAARNRGAQESSGELLAFLDADDVWLPKKVERQIERFQADPELGLVHCGVEEIDQTGSVLRLKLDGLEGWIARELLLFHQPAILGGGSGFMVSRKTFASVEGFDSRLSTSADWDFFYRVAVRQPVGFVPEVLLQYRTHNSNMHGNIRRMEHDMLLAYDKAFAQADSELRKLRRQCYGNLHMVLAGSFYTAGQYGSFLRHALKSLRLTPGNCSRLAGFPARRLRRLRGRRSSRLPA